MQIKCLIFDFDGTLVDTRKTIVASKQETMRRLQLPVLDEETCASTIGLSARGSFEKLYPSLSEDRIKECIVLSRKLFEEMKEEIPPVLFPGVRETLRSLYEAGYRLTIASSRNSVSLNEFLQKMEIETYFTYVLGGDDTAKLKPDPEPVLKTLEVFGYQPEEVLVVGDMPMDIAMGKGAQAKTCGVTYGNASRETLEEAGADYLIDEVNALCSLLNA